MWSAALCLERLSSLSVLTMAADDGWIFSVSAFLWGSWAAALDFVAGGGGSFVGVLLVHSWV